MARVGMVGRVVRRGQLHRSKYGIEVMVYSFGSRIRRGTGPELIRAIQAVKSEHA
jgi:hypothetical protein